MFFLSAITNINVKSEIRLCKPSQQSRGRVESVLIILFTVTFIVSRSIGAATRITSGVFLSATITSLWTWKAKFVSLKPFNDLAEQSRSRAAESSPAKPTMNREQSSRTAELAECSILYNLHTQPKAKQSTYTAWTARSEASGHSASTMLFLSRQGV